MTDPTLLLRDDESESQGCVKISSQTNFNGPVSGCIQEALLPVHFCLWIAAKLLLPRIFKGGNFLFHHILLISYLRFQKILLYYQLNLANGLLLI